MIKKRPTTNLGYALIVVTITLMVSVISFATYVHKKDFGYITIEFPKTGTLLIENEFTVFGTTYGKIVNLHNKPSGTAVATVKLNKPLTIHRGYHVYVYDIGLFGKRAICLENGPRKAPKVNTQHPLTGVYYPGIADILGSMYKMKVAFDELQILVDRAYGDDPDRAKLVQTINNIAAKTDRVTQKTSHFFKTKGINLSTAIPELQNNLIKGTTLLKKVEKTAQKLDTFDNTVLSDAKQLLKRAEKLDATITSYATTVNSQVDSLDNINLDAIPKKLMNIEAQLSSIVFDAHKLRLRIKRYNSED